MLLAARERGARVFEAFSNSPPFWMTVSGRASGHVLPFRGNLRAEREPDFVEYLVAVLARFREVHGLTFRCVLAPAPEMHGPATAKSCYALALPFRVG